MIAMVPEAIISKIKKCLALTSSNWEGESQNAMAAAQKLMEEYGLTQAEVEMTSDGQHIKDEAYIESAVESSHGLYTWERLLGIVIEYLLPVKCFVRRRAIVFIGAVSDSNMSTAFYRILFSEIQSLSKQEDNVTARRAFMYGCVKTLIARAREIAANRQKENGGGASRALVVVKKNDVAQYVRSHYNFANVRAKTPNDAYSDSVQRGRDAGHGVSLNPHSTIGGGYAMGLLS